MSQSRQDQWAAWLLHRRHGGDAEQLQKNLDFLYPIRDQVLDHAALKAGDIVLDVGAGDGLIGFGALEQVGPSGKVIFSDISQDLLDYTHELAAHMGVLDRCEFLESSADNLAALAVSSVHVITVRSVLIYVKTKRQCFAEFYRVLQPGGRLSIFEPINSFAYPEPIHQFLGYDVTPISTISQKLKAVYEKLQPPGEDPMLDFDEYDMLGLIEQSGFNPVRMTLEVEILPKTPMVWAQFLKISGNPRIPTIGEAMDETLSPPEASEFVKHMQPLVEAGRGVSRSAIVYFWAKKPR